MRSFILKGASLFLLFLISVNSFGSEGDVPGYTPKPVFVKGIDSPVINLNGSWQFLSSPPTRFWNSPGSDNYDWQQILVPGEWLMQGFEVEPNTRAAYRKEIEIPASWENHVIFLKCDGVYSDAEIYVNGKLAGSHTGGFTPFQADLSGFIKAGKINTLVIGVKNESLADTLASATQYAAHSLGGITRKLELYALPKVFIKKLEYHTVLDETNTDAQIVLDLIIANRGRKNAENLRTKISLAETQGASLLIPDKGNLIDPVPSGGEISHRLVIPVRKARLWDPEHPNLYNAVVSLADGEETIQKTALKIGIRQIDVVGNQVFINGKPIKLRGVNRHEVHPLKGRSLGMEEWMADVKLFREANVNYIRTSHYPPAEEFISLCDSIGFFVECEAPLCWVGHGANANWVQEDPHSNRLYSLIRQLVLETVAQYRNHPSVIIWSMANESAWGPIWESVLSELNELDPSRPVSFHDQAYGGYNNYGSARCQIANIHYPGPGGPEVAWKFERPLLFGEYAHLNTYNRQEIVTDPGVRDAWGRGLESMWENMYHSTGCLGGAIWSGIDDVFYLPEGKAVGYGEWGPVDGWRRPKPEYWHLKKIYSPVKIIARSFPVPRAGQAIRIPVENRHLFTDLSELKILWELGNQSGECSLGLPPGNSGILEISPGRVPSQNEELSISFYSPKGYKIDTYTLAVGEAVEQEYEAESLLKPEFLVFENRVSVSMGEEVWNINAVNGRLENVRLGNTQILTGGPDLMLLPLRTGPCNTEHSLDIEPLNDVCSGWKGRISGTGTEGNSVFVQVEGSYNEADIKITYWFGRKPGVELEYEITLKEDIDPRQIGLVFSMPREFDHLSWERAGQWTSYPETHIGRTRGSAIPFPGGRLVAHSFGAIPANIWEEDTHPMGSNDFRATRDKLIRARLANKEGLGITLLSDGSGAIRAFVEGDKIKFLAAGFSTAGGDMFFSSHLQKERKPLKKGDVFKSKIRLLTD